MCLLVGMTTATLQTAMQPMHLQFVKMRTDMGPMFPVGPIGVGEGVDAPDMAIHCDTPRFDLPETGGMVTQGVKGKGAGNARYTPRWTG